MLSSLSDREKDKLKMIFIFSVSIDNCRDVIRWFNSVIDENSIKVFSELTSMLF